MRIANLYCGIGGNRKNWGDEHEITAIEINPNVAKIYSDLFPKDTVIVCDAHEYLRQHFREFDFIWASPPCPTHSVLQMARYYDENLKYPDMTLYQEIILLQSFFKGDWVIENVKPYYQPLIEPSFKLGRHYFWSNKFILTNPIINNQNYDDVRHNISKMADLYGYDLKKYSGQANLRLALRNCVPPEMGKYIFDRISGGGKSALYQ